MNDISQKELIRAKKALLAAKTLLENQLYKDCVSRSYYAVLHAAKQSGIKTVILPARNKKDLPDVPKEAKKDLQFKFVKNTNEALKLALNTD